MRYVDGLATTLKPGGRLFLGCFSDEEPGTWGPRRVSKNEIEAAFGEVGALSPSSRHGFRFGSSLSSFYAEMRLNSVQCRTDEPGEYSMNSELFTIGHSNQSLDQYLGLLTQHRIEALVDV